MLAPLLAVPAPAGAVELERFSTGYFPGHKASSSDGTASLPSGQESCSFTVATSVHRNSSATSAQMTIGWYPYSAPGLTSPNYAGEPRLDEGNRVRTITLASTSGPTQPGYYSHTYYRPGRQLSGRLTRVHFPTNRTYRVKDMVMDGTLVFHNGQPLAPYIGGNYLHTYLAASNDQRAPSWATPGGSSLVPRPVTQGGAARNDVSVIYERSTRFTNHRWFAMDVAAAHDSCVNNGHIANASHQMAASIGPCRGNPNTNYGNNSNVHAGEPNATRRAMLTDESCAKDRQDHLNAGYTASQVDWWLQSGGSQWSRKPRWQMRITNDGLYARSRTNSDPFTSWTTLTPRINGNSTWADGTTRVDVGRQFGLQNVEVAIADATRNARLDNQYQERNQRTRTTAIAYDVLPPGIVGSPTTNNTTGAVQFTITDPGYTSRDGIGVNTGSTYITWRTPGAAATPGVQCTEYQRQNNGCVDTPPSAGTPAGPWANYERLTVNNSNTGQDRYRYRKTGLPTDAEFMIRVCDRLANCATYPGQLNPDPTDGGGFCLPGAPGCPPPPDCPGCGDIRDIQTSDDHAQMRVATTPQIDINVRSNDTSRYPLVNSTLEIVESPTKGTASVTASGWIRYRPTHPNGQQTGYDTLRYIIRDNQGNVSNATLVRIEFLDHAPLANNDLVVVRMEHQNSTSPPSPTRVPLLANDTDADCTPTYPNLRPGVTLTCPYGDIQDTPSGVRILSIQDRSGNNIAASRASVTLATVAGNPHGARTNLDILVHDQNLRGFVVNYQVRDSRGIWSNTAAVEVTVRSLAPT